MKKTVIIFIVAVIPALILRFIDIDVPNPETENMLNEYTAANNVCYEEQEKLTKALITYSQGHKIQECISDSCYSQEIENLITEGFLTNKPLLITERCRLRFTYDSNDNNLPLVFCTYHGNKMKCSRDKKYIPMNKYFFVTYFASVIVLV